MRLGIDTAAADQQRQPERGLSLYADNILGNGFRDHGFDEKPVYRVAIVSQTGFTNLLCSFQQCLLRIDTKHDTTHFCLMRNLATEQLERHRVTNFGGLRRELRQVGNREARCLQSFSGECSLRRGLVEHVCIPIGCASSPVA